MTTKHWLKKRLTHTCTITRDVGTAQSSTGQPTSVGSAVGTAIPCRWTETRERYGSESLGYVTLKERMLIFDADQDVRQGDDISNILDENGTAISTSTFDIEEIRTPRGVDGKIHHVNAVLERVEIT